VEGAHLLDVSPTLLELGGYDIPPSMQGRSLLGGSGTVRSDGPSVSPESEDEIRRRLSGLGYIS
jgi:hypothetical protein